MLSKCMKNITIRQASFTFSKIYITLSNVYNKLLFYLLTNFSVPDIQQIRIKYSVFICQISPLRTQQTTYKRVKAHSSFYFRNIRL